MVELTVSDWVDAQAAERPAFPQTIGEPPMVFDEATGEFKVSEPQPHTMGLTVQQWYQGKALQGLCAGYQGAFTPDAMLALAAKAKELAIIMCDIDQGVK